MVLLETRVEVVVVPRTLYRLWNFWSHVCLRLIFAWEVLDFGHVLCCMSALERSIGSRSIDLSIPQEVLP